MFQLVQLLLDESLSPEICVIEFVSFDPLICFTLMQPKTLWSFDWILLEMNPIYLKR